MLARPEWQLSPAAGASISIPGDQTFNPQHSTKLYILPPPIHLQVFTWQKAKNGKTLVVGVKYFGQQGRAGPPNMIVGGMGGSTIWSQGKD